jgi:hypothetical protein
MRLGRPLIALLACALIAPTAAGAATFEPISANGFGLKRTGLNAAAYAQIAKLEKTYPAASVGAVLASANRKVRPLGDPPALRAVRDVAGGFRWNTGDDNVSYWYPQGITGSADATADGIVDGRRALLVSWYSKNGKGARISFVSADRLASATYRHVLLVDRKLRPITTHAGGIAWFGNYLYVAETHGGLRVFDLRHILKVPPARALGYEYALPQAGSFRTTSKSLVFSYVSVDRTSSSLVTGEYRKGRTGGRIVRWRLDPASGLVVPGPAAAAFAAAIGNVQGALSLNGHLATSSSAGKSPGTLMAGMPGQAAAGHPWSIGAEDLSFAQTSGRVYSLTEVPGARTVFGVPASSIGLQ